MLIQAFAAEGVRYCILRNYEGFPDRNSGNDIDFLISAQQLPLAMRAIRSIHGVRIVGYTERTYVANFYLEGISRPAGDRALQIDFDLMLPWKGLSFLNTEAVLGSAIPRVAGDVSFFVPTPIYESIISLFTRLVIAGQLKEKYFPDVQRTFADNRPNVISVLRTTFGLKTAMRLVDSVIDGDRRKVLDCVGPLRTSLAVRSLLRRPVRSLLAIVRHYANELAFRFSPGTLETVSILGSDQGLKATVVDWLFPCFDPRPRSRSTTSNSRRLLGIRRRERHHLQILKPTLPGANYFRRFWSFGGWCTRGRTGSRQERILRFISGRLVTPIC
jgi:hypothetical protein